MSLASERIIIGSLQLLLRSNMYIFIFDNLVLPEVLDQSWILKFTTLLDLANECNVRIVVDLIISHSNCTKDTLVKLEVSLEQLELRLRVKEIV